VVKTTNTNQEYGEPLQFKKKKKREVGKARLASIAGARSPGDRFSVSSGLCPFAEFIHVNSLVAFVACAFSV
jgi:hypothetical protein